MDRDTSPIHLDQRAVLSVRGADAEPFLQKLLTQSVEGMETGAAAYGALLTPQGKVIADMILQRQDDGFLIDAPIQADEALLKRLNMLRLRASVEIAPEPDLAVYAFVPGGFDDPRSPLLPQRAFKPVGAHTRTSPHLWRRTRIEACVPEQGSDFGESEVFPADINMDFINGVDFKKGCFIGQEVVSRMKRRGTSRRRTLLFKFADTAPDRGAPVSVGEETIGEITSREGELALARVRIDRMAKAVEALGDAFHSDERQAELIKPDWLDGQIEAISKA